MNEVAAIVQAGAALLWPLLAILVVLLYKRSLRALLSRPNVAVELPGFKITAGGQEQIAERFKQARELKQVGRSSDELPRQDAALLVGAAEMLGRPAKILWVDDEPSRNRFELEALDWVQAAVDLSVSTDQALAKVDLDDSYDVIISDMGRPEGEYAGYDLLSTLRRRGIQTPFIIYSWYEAAKVDKYFNLAVEKGALGSTRDPVGLAELIARGLRVSAGKAHLSRRQGRKAWRRPAVSRNGSD